MILRTTRRPGVTLMEVLIATGILAIGMLAIMALFPIGAVSMARAINQNRAADHAANSDAVFRYYWKKAWLDPNGGGVRSSALEAYIANPNEEMIPLLDRQRPINPLTPDILANSQQPSYPVFIDPIGYHTQASFGLTNQLYVAGMLPTVNAMPPPATYLRMPQRASLAAAEADPLPRTRVRLTTLLDDMTWDNDGEPANYTGQLERGGRYNCVWYIQRPKNNIPHEVRLYVLVYGGRSPTDTPAAETTFSATAFNYVANVDPKPNSITVALNGQSMPNIRRGGWVAFNMQIQPKAVAAPASVPYPTLDFYRVSAVTDDIATNGTITLEFEQPLRTYDTMTLGAQYDPVNFTLTGTVVFFDNLIEVFDRGMVSAQSITGR